MDRGDVHGADQCHTAGACNRRRSVESGSDGTTCNDGNVCTTAQLPRACSGLRRARRRTVPPRTCNPSTALEPVANGTTCNDGNACTPDSCQAELQREPGDCTARTSATGRLQPVDGGLLEPDGANGTACNDGNACTQTDTCQAGPAPGRDR